MPTDANIDATRRFSRFYTRRIGVLHEGLLGSPFSLAEGGVLYELATRDTTTAVALSTDLGIDAGYLSRILTSFETKKLLKRTASPTDARQNVLKLTRSGRTAFDKIDTQSRAEVGFMLAALSLADQRRVIVAMAEIEVALSSTPREPAPVTFRAHRAGDMGWVTHRHGVIYAEEFGWDETFESLVGTVVAEFVEKFLPGKDRCFIAEQAGAIVGSAFVVRKSAKVAKLRLVYVEHAMRGTGLGRRLVEEATTFARAAGYTRMTLWTNDVLIPARRLYESLGFEMTASEAYRGFGKDLVGETWERDL